MSKIKPKITKWEYVANPFDVYAFATAIRRAHAPLDPSLSINPGGIAYLHLRPCVQGVDQDGAVIKYLYCTRDGRFFVRKKDGWGEILPTRSINAPKSKKCGGGGDCVFMRDFGNKSAHRCVAFAWLDVPRDVKLQMIGVDAPTKWEVDHINTDHRNWTADNLQWVTAEENRRRAKIIRALRKQGFDPTSCTTDALRTIFRNLNV